MVKSEAKTAIYMGIAVAGIAGIASLWLQQLDAPAEPVVAPDGTLDKSGLPTAPALAGISGYINTSGAELASAMEGKVVMYDIWTYSCINCVRTLPHITAWDDKYADKGLLIIGVHTPEFEFEKDFDNVSRAVQKHGIAYPVVMDNDREIWDAFENRYWPRKYIADHEGFIRYDHIGEGAYAETERVIQDLLAERAASMGLGVASAEPLVDIGEFEHTRMRTPELYLGYQLAFGRSQLGNEEGFRPGQTVSYQVPDSQARHMFYMGGDWQNNSDHMRMVSAEGRIVLPYEAKQVNIVASGAALVEVSLDGAPVPGRIAGSDLDGSALRIDGPGLYNVIEGGIAEGHTIELRASGDLEMYTFTFG